MYYVCALLSHVWLFASPWTVAHQTPLSRGFSRREYWSGWPFPTPEHLPHPGIEPTSLVPLALAGRFFTNSATREGSIQMMATVKILTGLCPWSPLNPWTSWSHRSLIIHGGPSGHLWVYANEVTGGGFLGHFRMRAGRAGKIYMWLELDFWAIWRQPSLWGGELGFSHCGQWFNGPSLCN